MMRQKSISDRLLLGAIFFGLNLLCFFGVMHGHHVVHHTRVNYSHITAHATRRAGSRNSRDSVAFAVDANFDHSAVDHAPKVTLSKSLSTGKTIFAPAAVAATAFVLPRPEGRTEPLAQENVIALGSAPRAPGLGRAPPIAA